MAKCRVTMRSGRVGSAKHNDRSFLNGREDQASEVAPHIDLERSVGNRVLSWQGRTNDIESAELDYYKKHYSDALEKTNANYRREGHADRCKTIEELYHGRLTRPEELILQIGDMNNHANENEFVACVSDYIREFESWNKAHGNHGHILSVAVHVDEQTPHAHIRRVWDYEKDGLTCLGQNKGLEQAGVELPNPEKKADRFNNRKMTFDVMMREKWQEICKAHGMDIETEARPNMTHKDKADYIAEQINKDLDERRENLNEMQHEVQKAAEVIANAEMLREEVEELEERQKVYSAKHFNKIADKAKSSLFSDDIKISKDDFTKLLNNASMAKEAMAELNEVARKKKEADKLIAEAKSEAEAILQKAQERANSFDEHLPSIQLNQIQDAYPELFNEFGVFDDGKHKTKDKDLVRERDEGMSR